MIYAIVIVTVVVFVLVDITVRLAMRRAQAHATMRERRKALDVALQLDFAEDLPSLRRATVPNPKATILAVDDEAVVLDSLRKALVLAGYSVDTVESGREALALARDNAYDFVYTDLKMPEMDGVEVTKAVRHLCPDTDVIIITGYATVESAVETMKVGATDYVQKPFTSDEIATFTDQVTIRRRHRVEQAVKPVVHLVTPSSGEAPSKHACSVPAGVFVAPGHTWVALLPNGEVRVGLDDFAAKLVGRLDEIDMPEQNSAVAKGQAICVLKQDDEVTAVATPIEGRVTTLNEALFANPELLTNSPYDSGWICCMEAADLPAALRRLKIGAEAVSWYRDEIDKLVELRREGPATDDDHSGWRRLNEAFLHA